MNYLRALIFLAILILSLIVGKVSHATEQIVFTDTKQLYMDLQQYQQCKDLTLAQDKELTNKDSKISNYASEARLLVEMNNIAKEQVTAHKSLVASQDENINRLKHIIDIQKNGYEKVIEASKPSFFEQLKNNIVFIAVGVVIGILL